jgi:hypothetical protein
MLTLQKGGTFSQRVCIAGNQPVSVRGTWEFESRDSRVNLRGALVVTDGFGRLRPEWQQPSTGIVSLDVETHWFRVVIASAAKYPYVKA